MYSPGTLRVAGFVAAALMALLTAVTSEARPAQVAPEAGRTVTLDAFTATAGQVARLRADGARPVCRLRVAVWEPHRPDAARFPSAALADHVGLFGDRWLDIRRWDTIAPVLADRMRLCRQKGFELVRLGDDWAHPGGVGLTGADWQRFGARVNALADEHGLALVAAR
jgi:hypothetical protein